MLYQAVRHSSFTQGADAEAPGKAAAYDALLDAFAEDIDHRLAEINATLDRLAA